MNCGGMEDFGDIEMLTAYSLTLLQTFKKFTRFLLLILSQSPLIAKSILSLYSTFLFFKRLPEHRSV